MHGDFVADQILFLGADHAAIFQHRFQLGFIQQLEALRHGAGADPLGQRQLDRIFQGQRHYRQRAQRFTQQGQSVFRFLRAGAVDHDQAVNGIDPHHRLAEAAEGARQQRVQHFIFQGIFLGLLQLAALIGFQLLDLRLQRLLDHRRRQDLFFFTRADNDLAVCRMRQRVAVRSHRRHPTGFRHILAATRGKCQLGQLFFHLLGAQFDIAAETVNH